MTVRRISEAACRQGIPILTLFAFSSENWKRPGDEVRILFNLFQRYLLTERQALLGNDIRLSAFGRRDRIPPLVREALASAERETRHCKRLHLRIALDYGARHEIMEAARALAGDVMLKGLKIEQITEEDFVRKLSPEGVPDPGPHHPHRGRETSFEFPSLAGSLFRILFLSKAVARL